MLIQKIKGKSRKKHNKKEQKINELIILAFNLLIIGFPQIKAAFISTE